MTKAKLYTYAGKTMTLREWSRETGLKIGTIQNRMHDYGMTFEEAVTKPLAKNSRRPRPAKPKPSVFPSILILPRAINRRTDLSALFSHGYGNHP